MGIMTNFRIQDMPGQEPATPAAPTQSKPKKAAKPAPAPEPEVVAEPEPELVEPELVADDVVDTEPVADESAE